MQPLIQTRLIHQFRLSIPRSQCRKPRCHPKRPPSAAALRISNAQEWIKSLHRAQSTARCGRLWHVMWRWSRHKLCRPSSKGKFPATSIVNLSLAWENDKQVEMFRCTVNSQDRVMQHGDDDDDDQNLTPRPGSGLRPVHRPAQTDPTPPSFVKVLLCIGVVGLTFIGLMSFIVVVGVSTLWTMVEEHSEAEARKQAAEVAKYSHFVPFKPGDPLPEPPLDLLPPAIPSARLGKYDLTEIDGRSLAALAIHR